MPTVTVTRPGTEAGGQTPPALQDLAQPKYNFNYLAFPSDLGMDYSGHYMVININVPTKTTSNEAAGNYTNQFEQTDRRSKVDTLRGLTGSSLPITAPVLGSAGTWIWNGGQRILSSIGLTNAPAVAPPPSSAGIAIPRATKRIVESVALHMPTPIVFSHQNEYQEISLTALGGKIGSAVAGVAGGIVGGLSGGAAGGALGAIGVSRVADATGQQIGNVAKLMQMPINPAVEVLFSNTTIRSFTFEVLMAPRNEYESETIKAIIKTMKFHSAPELSFGGLIWIPPAEFDITFFNKGVENMNILRVNTCVLERLEVDYAPTGIYSTFRSGHPVAVRLSMGFRELEPIHKQRVLQGF